MHVRTSKKKSGGKTYEYAQLVESYRRKDGVSTKRVIAHLGKQPKAVIDALRIALKAASVGDTLLLKSEVAQLIPGPTVANRRYLDLAVLIECWHQWELSALLDELGAGHDTSLSLAEVVLPLVLQRCCAPKSKLAATRWLPKTALPELIGFDIPAFNNSRLHRALQTLYEVTGSLQQRLCERYQSRDGVFGALFMDVTDTYFEGIGCPMAELTRTKTKMPHKRCLGIVLLVNERGYPLRWKVVGGKTKDWHAMGGLLEDIGEVSWLADTPMVFDRAMGNQKTVKALKDTQGVRFLTAAHVTAIESYTKDVPFSAVANVELEGTDESYKQDIERVAEAARSAGFEEIHPRLFAIDLGVTVPASEQDKSDEASATSRGRGRPILAAKHLKQAHAIQSKMAADSTLSQKDVAASLGVSPTHAGHLLALLRLAPAVQERILQWDDRFPFGEKYLRSLLHLAPDEQLATLVDKLAAHTTTASEASASPEDDESIGLLRLVAYFNPQLFVDIRRRTTEHCEKLQRHVEEFNADLAAPKRSRKREATYRKFAHEVERLNYSDLFDIELTPITVTSKTGRSIASFQGSITRDETAWQRRRRYDGFVLLLGHPELPHTAGELVNLYRVKDTVEKDFQTIKSVIKLRPLFCYTDPKVQAHVTLCMLALLMERTLENQLRAADLPMSAPACIEVLEPCRLNQRQSDDAPIYDVTRTNTAQREILAALDLEHLADDEYLRDRIVPRPLPEPAPAARKHQRRARRLAE